LSRDTGRSLGEDDGLSTLLNLSNALIVSVKEPQPGAWMLRVSVSTGQSSVRVTGLSPLDFSHGFSRAPVHHLRHTEPRPVSGQSPVSSQPSEAHCCHMDIAAIKHPVPDHM